MRIGSALRLAGLSLTLCGLTVDAAAAATVWSGPTIVFEKSDFADPTDPANQDAITPLVAITRDDFAGIYNAASESAFADGSPAGTEWAFTLNNSGVDAGDVNAANHAALSFDPWKDSVLSSPPSSVGVPGVLHLIAEDIYLDIRFLSWTESAGGGGFSYQRATPEPTTGALLLLGLAGLASRRRL